MGVSGVNFGVADGGAIAIVTNEGNGRMVTTLPRVHIALMGIERLVPTYDDLALVLTLLPRAATGQTISVYVQILHGPRRSEEIDGAQERHIVLVDNGRSAIRGTSLNDTLFCIRCGACLNACPIFREIGGYTYASVNGDYTPYPGPIGSALSPALFSHVDFGHLAQASTLCGACKEACPMDIDLPTMLLRVRAGASVNPEMESLVSKAKPMDGQAGIGLPSVVRLGLRAFTWFAASPKRFAFAQKMAGIFSSIWSPRTAWMKLPAFTGWGYSKDFPRPAVRTFRDRWRRQDAGTGERISTNSVSIEPLSLSPDQAPQSPNGSPTTPLIDRFQNELETLGGIFIRCQETELSTRILALLREKNVDTLAAWENDHLPHGLLAALRTQGTHVQHQPDPTIKVGITGSLAGIAETGTLVLTSGSGKPQTASLLTECHIALLREADLKENLAQALSLRKVQEAAAVSLISGPSKTADIEMTLTVGVHGPGEVIVFCI
jgi:L-lactate utilization protein LutB